MIIFNKLDNYFVVSADSQTFLGFEIMTANFCDTSPLRTVPPGFATEHTFCAFWAGLRNVGFLMRCKTMQEKENLARAVEMQKENWGNTFLRGN